MLQCGEEEEWRRWREARGAIAEQATWRLVKRRRLDEAANNVAMWRVAFCWK
jgi:hypothetical protein